MAASVGFTRFPTATARFPPGTVPTCPVGVARRGIGGTGAFQRRLRAPRWPGSLLVARMFPPPPGTSLACA